MVGLSARATALALSVVAAVVGTWISLGVFDITELLSMMITDVIDKPSSALSTW